MNGLDLPLEALTFIPVNLATLISAAANNLWAWLAVITATLSLWRFRTTATKTTSSLISLPPPPPPTTTTQTPTKPTSTTTRTPSFKCTDDRMEKQEEEGVLTRGNSKKFYSVYFEERENINQRVEGEDEYDDDDEMMEGGDEVENESRVVMIKRWGSSSELTVEMRRGDFGWYNYQNRKVIDGSVVRLWKEEREEGCCGSPRSCRSRRGTALVLA